MQNPLTIRYRGVDSDLYIAVRQSRFCVTVFADLAALVKRAKSDVGSRCHLSGDSRSKQLHIYSRNGLCSNVRLPDTSTVGYLSRKCGLRYWPIIDDALRLAAVTRGVELRLLVGALHYVPQTMVFLRSLQALNNFRETSIKVVWTPLKRT